MLSLILRMKHLSTKMFTFVSYRSNKQQVSKVLVMNAHTLTLFKVLQKYFSEEEASLVVEAIEQITKKKIAEQEDYTTKSIHHQVERKIDDSIERKIEKEHKYLATKGDIIAVEEKIVVVEEKIVKVEEKIMTLREEIIKQYRSFLTVNIAVFAIIVSILIYLVTKIA